MMGAQTLIMLSKEAAVEEVRSLLPKLEPDNVTLIVAGDLIRSENITRHVETLGAYRVVLEPRRAKRGNMYRFAGLGPLAMFRSLNRIYAQRRWARTQLKRPDVGVLMVFEDRIVDPEMIWLDEAARHKIPAILIRYASSSMESDAWTRKGRTAYSLDRGVLAWARRKFARRYPAHALEIGMGRQLFYTLWDSLALAISGMTNTLPWISGGGQVACVCLQGRADLDEVVRVTGILERFHVTGQPSWDKMAFTAAQRKSAQEAIRLTGISQGPILLCALPQWGEHHQLSWQEHMAKIARLCEILSGSGCATILSLHPKADRRAYEQLAARHGMRIADQPLSEILPAADIFVASWSSTLRWSAMLGIPSINLDWANQSYTLFGALKSLPLSRNPEDLAALIGGLACDEPGRQALGKQLLAESAVYGSIDGKAGQRILSLVENLAVQGTYE